MGTKNATSTATQTPPSWVSSAYQNLFSKAGDTAGTGFTPYTGGFTGDQQGAFQTIRDLKGTSSPAFGAANDAFGRALVPSYARVSDYMNPYVSNVVNATMANMQEMNARQQQDLLGNAVQRGSLGGNRVGVAQAELARQQNLANQQTISGLWNEGYANALNAAQAQQQTELSGGSALAGLGQTQMNTGLAQAAAQLGAGTQQQQFDYQQYLNKMGFPYQQGSWLASILGGVGPSAGGTTTQQVPQGNIFSQLLGAGLGIASLFKDGGVVRAASGGVMPYANDNGDWPGLQYNLVPYASNDNSPFTSYVPTVDRISGGSSPFPTIEAPQEQDDFLSSHGSVLRKGASNVKSWFTPQQDLGLKDGGVVRRGLKWQGRERSKNIEDRRDRVSAGNVAEDYNPYFPYADDGAKNTGTFKKQKKAYGGVVRGYADGGALPADANGTDLDMFMEAFFNPVNVPYQANGMLYARGMHGAPPALSPSKRVVQTMKVDANGDVIDTVNALNNNSLGLVHTSPAVVREDTASGSVIPMPRPRPLPTVDAFAIAAQDKQRGTPAQALFDTEIKPLGSRPTIGGDIEVPVTIQRLTAQQTGFPGGNQSAGIQRPITHDYAPVTVAGERFDVMGNDMAFQPRSHQTSSRWNTGYADGGVVRPGYAPGGYVPYGTGAQFVTDPTPGYSQNIGDVFSSLQAGKGLNLAPDMRQALLSAGAGMMASRSPFALQGIGEGALKGIESWNTRQQLERENAQTRANIGQTGEQIALQAARTAAEIPLLGAQTGATRYTFQRTPAGVQVTDALNPTNVQFVPWGGVLPDGSIANPADIAVGDSIFTTEPIKQFDPRLMAPETTPQAVNEASSNIGDARVLYDSAQSTQQQLQEMQHNFDSLPENGWLAPGNDFTNRLYMARGVNTALTMMGLSPVFDEKQVAAGEDLNKLTTRLGFELSNGVGSTAATIVTDAVAAVPGGANSREGAERIINGLEAMNRRRIDYYHFIQNWAAQNNGSTYGAAEYFNKKNPPELYALTAYVPEQSIRYLREHPDTASAFNAKYGNGRDVARYVLSAGG